MTSSDPVCLVVCGAAGRMGRLLIQLAREDPALRVVGAVEAPGHPAVGHDAGVTAGGASLGLAIEDELAGCLHTAPVVIDFTGNPDATVQHAALAADHRLPLVVGTTGFDARQREELATLATRTRSVVAANFSIGITVLIELVGRAARLLDPSFEAEIVEIHHHAKRDAPSGTALALGRTIAAARGLDFDEATRCSREGLVGARPPDEIGIVALRAGDAVGDHTVVLGGLGERLELVHRAQSRECLVRGALRAARWVVDQPVGLYSMRDVLGL
jgi:4-hydroxy-tetrahydrodipicolinate reductase